MYHHLFNCLKKGCVSLSPVHKNISRNYHGIPIVDLYQRTTGEEYYQGRIKLIIIICVNRRCTCKNR